MRITKDYDTHEKADLQSEADFRQLSVKGTGANGAIVKADLVSALEDNDTAPAQPPAPLPPLKASKLPQITAKELPAAPGDVPSDEDYNDGVFAKKDDGEEYAIAILDDAPNGRTHFAKNSAHFWNGTEAEFDAQFSKK